MPRYNLILNLPGFTIEKISGYQPLVLDVRYKRLARCSHCFSKEVRKKASKIREVHHELIGHRKTLLLALQPTNCIAKSVSAMGINNFRV